MRSTQHECPIERLPACSLTSAQAFLIIDNFFFFHRFHQIKINKPTG